MLRVRLIGELALEVDGSGIPPPPSRRARSLLAWLALHPGLHSRSELAARFWLDVLDASARTSLRSALMTLRNELGPLAGAHLVTTRDSIGFPRDGDDWVYAARDEHRDLLMAAYGRLADGAEEKGDLAAAARWTRHLAAHDPLSEDAHRELIR